MGERKVSDREENFACTGENTPATTNASTRRMQTSIRKRRSLKSLVV
jgi:hypothetical protein